jgi:phosphomannomutase
MQYGVASLVLPQVAQSWGVDLVGLRSFVDSEHTVAGGVERAETLEELSATVPMFEADLGAALDTSGERLRLVTSSGRVLDTNTAMHAVVELWCASDETDRRVVVPLTASRVVDELAMRHGHSVTRSGRSPREIAVEVLRGGVGLAASQDGGFVLPGFLAAYDAVVALGLVTRLISASGRTLDEVVDSLPPFHLLDERVQCPSEQKGTVMRTVMEEAAAGGLQAETTEGVRVFLEDGWALVLPHPSEPVVTVFVEGRDEEAARRILARYTESVREVAAAAPSA